MSFLYQKVIANDFFAVNLPNIWPNTFTSFSISKICNSRNSPILYTLGMSSLVKKVPCKRNKELMHLAVQESLRKTYVGYFLSLIFMALDCSIRYPKWYNESKITYTKNHSTTTLSSSYICSFIGFLNIIRKSIKLSEYQVFREFVIEAQVRDSFSV